MVVISELPRNKILVGDAEEQLRELPGESVDMVMTSPPYWGLRDYGVNGQLGLEESPDRFVKHLMEVFEEVRRVLKPTGVCWVNLDDTYAGSNNGAGAGDHKESYTAESPPSRNPDVRRKSLAMIPERFAFAMVDRGWILRSKTVWEKPNPMPESVTDRPSTVWEYLFMFTKEPQYYFDLDAIREEHKENSLRRAQDAYTHAKTYAADHLPDRDGAEQVHNFDSPLHPKGKNPGNVWEVPTACYSDAHFAVFPEELVERPVKASPRKVCAECGRPWRRDTEESSIAEWRPRREQEREAVRRFKESDLRDEHLEAIRAVGMTDAGKATVTQNTQNSEKKRRLAEEAKEVLGGYFRELVSPPTETVGWSPQCDCSTDEWEKGVVLDPFAGAGTTCLVARQQNRHYVGIELNEEYAEMARQRIREEVGEKPLDEFV